jgi:endonuclease/exonuclease/phosphatase (EEP) superfamily protein YafD
MAARSARLLLMTTKQSGWRNMLGLIGWIAVVYPAWLAVSEWLGATTPRITAWGQTFLHWFIIPTGILGFLATRLRFRALAAVALLTTLSLSLTTFFAMRPYPIPSAKPGDEQLTVAFANVYNNNTQTAAIADALVASDADVIVVAELTPPVLRAINTLGAKHPFQAGSADPANEGIALWSRYPITRTENRRAGHAALLVTLDVHGKSVQLFAVHPFNNGIGIPNSDWERSADEVARQSDAITGPTIVVGDFNATLAHPPLRQMQDNGYREVHSWLGHGLSPSWPTDRGFPPLFRIDHAFVRGAVAPLAVKEIPIPGGDHRGFKGTFLLSG